MAINMNLVRLKNQLEQIKAEVQARVGRATDDDGHANSDLFKLKNPDLPPMGEWIAARTAEAQKCQLDIDDYLKADGALEEFDTLIETGKERTKGALVPTTVTRRRLSDITKSEDWAAFSKAAKGNTLNFDYDINLKSLFETTTSGAADNVSVESVRTGEYVTLPRTRVTILDIIPQLPTTQNIVRFDRETKNLSNVERIAQGAVYSESQFTIEEDNATVTKSGAFIQVSEELLEDAPEMRSRLDGNLTSQMMRRIQDDIIGGAPVNDTEYVGTPTNNTDIEGFLDIPNAQINRIDGNAGASSGEYNNPIDMVENAVEAIYRNGEADADAILMNSQDWLKITQLQATTGQYIARGALQPISMPVERAINDLPVVFCNALPAGTVIVGAFRDHCAIRDRQSVQVRIQEAQNVPVGSINTHVQTQPSGRFNIYTDARYAFYVRRAFAFARITDFGVAA